MKISDPDFPEIEQATSADYLLIYSVDLGITGKIKLSNLNLNSGSSSETTLTYQSDGDTNGLFYWIGTNENTVSFSNPHTSGKVIVSMSSFFPGHNNPQYLCSREIEHEIATDNIPNSWFKINLQNYRIKPNYYSIRGRNYPGNNPNTYKVQVSNDDATWIDLDSQTNKNLQQNQWFSTPISNQSTAYQFIRILQNGLSSSGDNIFCIGEFEIYGIASKV